MKFIAAMLGALILALPSIVSAQEAKRGIPQPTLIAFPRVPSTDLGKDAYTYFNENSHVQQTVAAIQTVLGERKVQYKGFAQAMQDVKKKEMQNKGLSIDPNALIAMQSGADIKLVFTTEVTNEGPFTKVRVSIEVEEVATSKGLGTVLGTSDNVATNDLSGLCISAVNNCIDRLLATVQSFWQDIPTEGKPARIIISSVENDLTGDINGQYFQDVVNDLLKSNTISYKPDNESDHIMEYTCNVDLTKYTQIGDFAREMRKLLGDLVKPAKVKVNTEGNALIRIELP